MRKSHLLNAKLEFGSDSCARYMSIFIFAPMIVFFIIKYRLQRAHALIDESSDLLHPDNDVNYALVFQ